MNARDEVVLRLPCYEPAGHHVELTLDELTQHVLLLGSTGSGKTSVLNEVLWQLLHYRAGDPARQPGLLILDGKGDDTVAKVRAWAKAAGRAADLQVLDGDGTASYPLFAPLAGPDGVETVLRRVLAGAAPMSQENRFWEESRAAALRAALTLLAVDAGPRPYGDRVGELSAWLLNGEAPPQLERLRARSQAPGVSAFTRQRLRAAVGFVGFWAQLDPRTRSNIQATLVPVFHALSAAVAEPYLAGPQAAVVDPGAVVGAGRILLASINAVTHRDVGQFLFRLLKEEFFAAVQARAAWEPARERLAVLVVDEWPLLVTPGDATQLGTCRSKGAAVLAATQGVAPLVTEVGPERALTLVLNFNTLCFLRSRELEVDLLALRQMGEQMPPRKRPRPEPDSDVWPWPELPVLPPQPQSVCPPGALGRLEAHQAYVARGADRYLEPVWFVPRYFTSTDPKEELFLSERELRAEAERMDELMWLAGWGVQRHEPQLGWLTKREDPEAAAPLRLTLRMVLAQAGWGTPAEAGLRTLPVAWLKGLARLLVKLPVWLGGSPPQLAQLGQWRGRLVLRFADEAKLPEGSGEAVRWRQRLQGPLYPSAYRPLLVKDRAWLWQAHPELRAALTVTAVTEYPEF